MGAEWMPSGACTRGSTVPRKGATKRVPGGAVMMSTPSRTSMEERDDSSVLRARTSVSPDSRAARQVDNFDRTRCLTDDSAEMSVMPRGVDDGGDGLQFLGGRSGLDARDHRAVLACSRRVGDL